MSNTAIPTGSDLKARGQRLRYLRQEVMGLTIIDFSKFCRMGDSTIRQYEKGRISGLTDRAITTLIERLQDTVYCSFEWLASGSGDPPVLKQAPVEELSENQLIQMEEERIDNEIKRFQTEALNPIVMRVQDDAMAPTYLPGDYVGGSRYIGNDIEKCVEEICIIQTTTNHLLLRKLQYGAKPGRYRLYNLNPTTHVTDPVHIDIEIMCAAPVTRLWRLPSPLSRKKNNE